MDAGSGKGFDGSSGRKDGLLPRLYDEDVVKFPYKLKYKGHEIENYALRTAYGQFLTQGSSFVKLCINSDNHNTARQNLRRLCKRNQELTRGGNLLDELKVNLILFNVSIYQME